MAENTTVGPAGANSPAHSATKPDNFGTTQNGGGETSGSGNGEAMAGPDQSGQDSFSNAGGGAASSNTPFNGDGEEDRTVSVDGNIP